MIIIIIIKVEIYDAVDLCTIRLQLWDVFGFREKATIPLYPTLFYLTVSCVR